MARPLRIAFPGAFYHVTARGNERKAVFKSKRDRETRTVDAVLGETPRLSRKVKIFLCRKHTTESLAAIGDRFGIGDSAVAQSYSRFLNEIKTDCRLRRQVDKIEKIITMCNVET